MGSGELRVLMGGGPKGPPLRISETKSRIGIIQTALERALQTASETVPLTFFSLPVTSQEGQTKVKQCQGDNDLHWRVIRSRISARP